MSALSHDIIKSLRNATGDVFHEIINIYINDALSIINEMESLIQGNNIEQLRHLVHTLKGSSRNVGALKIADLCAAFEAILKSALPCDTKHHARIIRLAYEETLPLLESYIVN